MKNLFIVACLAFSMPVFAQKVPSAATPPKVTATAPASELLKADGVDPVCKMKVAKGTSVTTVHEGKQIGFCSEHCKETFLKKPSKYVKKGK